MCDILISFLKVVELSVRKDDYNLHFVEGKVNFECVSLFGDNLHVIDTILLKYSKDKLKTCFEYNRNVFNVAVSALGIDWKEEQNGIYFHESGFYDKQWILFNLHEIIWDNQDKSVGMLSTVIYFCKCNLICRV